VVVAADFEAIPIVVAGLIQALFGAIKLLSQRTVLSLVAKKLLTESVVVSANIPIIFL